MSLTRITRPPTVAEYERMTATARIVATQRLAAQIARIEALRDGATRVPTVDMSPEDTRAKATKLARFYARTHGDTPEAGALRLAELNAAAATWDDPRRRRRNTKTATRPGATS